MAIDRRIVTATMVLTAGRAGSQFLGVLATLITARLLTPDDFGLIAIAMAVYSMSAALTELPVAAMLVRMPVIDRADTDTAWTINLIRGTLASLVMLAAAPLIAHLFGDGRLLGLTAALSVYPFLLGLRNPAFELHARAMEFRFEAMIEFSARLAAFLLAASIAWWFRSYWALPVSLLASGVTALILSFILRPYMPRPCLSRAGRFMHFSLWMSAARITESLRFASATFFLGRFVSPAAAGSLSVAARFSDQVEFVLIAPFERSLYAGFSAIQDRQGALCQLYLRTISAVALILLPACAGIALLSGPIIAVLAGPGWEQAGVALGWMAIMTAAYGLAAPALSLMTALGAVRWVFGAQLGAALVHAGLLMLLGFTGGLAGVLAAMTAGCAAWMGLTLAFPVLRFQIPVLAHLAAWARPLIATIFMVVFLTYGAMTSDMHDAEAGLMLARLAGDVLLGACVYAIAIILLWLLAGRPAGPESQILSFLRHALSPRSAGIPAG